MAEREDIIGRLARIRRLIANLERECGRSADLLERFEELKRQIDAIARPAPPRKS